MFHLGLRSLSFAIVLLLLGTTDAFAYRLWLESGPVDNLSPGQTVTVEVHLDSEADTLATWFSVAVVYPAGLVQYDRTASSVPSYILYSPPGYMVPFQDSPPPGPKAWPVTNDQVNVDFLSPGLVPVTATPSDVLLATLEFDVVAEGSGDIALSLSRGGNTFVISDGGYAEIAPSVGLGAALPINVAVPSVPALGRTAALFTLVLLTVLGRRKLSRGTRFRTLATVAALTGALVLATASAGPGQANSGGAGPAGPATDTDSDGVPDDQDNCLTVPNGPALALTNCLQDDADNDGYGTACDTDVNNDGATGLDELIGYHDAAGTSDPLFDFDCDGFVGINDHLILFAAAKEAKVVGPSGLSCAGTIPCP